MQAEGKLLRLAKERGVCGVTQLFAHQELNSTANLHQGLQFEKPRAPLLANSQLNRTRQVAKSSPPGKRKRDG
jgi:hypothetical protein